MTDEATSKEDTKPLYFKIIEYFLIHPAIGGSCIYILVSAIGFLNASLLYFKFQINIFDYAETNDFLMAAFKDPLAFFMTIIFFFSVGLYYHFIKTPPSHMRRGCITGVAKGFIVVVFAGTMASIALVFIPLLREYRIIKKKASIVNVLYEKGKRGLKPVVKEGVSLIGSTEKFMFFYNPSNKRTIVIPITKIISITTLEKKP